MGHLISEIVGEVESHPNCPESQRCASARNWSRRRPSSLIGPIE
jgi:hypothetical protein